MGRKRWNNPSLHLEYVLLLLVGKEADWPRSRQDKFRQDNKTEDTGAGERLKPAA